MTRLRPLLILILLVAGLAGPAEAQPPRGSAGPLPAAAPAGIDAVPAGSSTALQSIVWDKYVDGVTWQPGMEITRQTSDTIEIVEVLHLTPQPGVLWDQPLSAVNQGAYVSQEFIAFPAYTSFLADDFVNYTQWLISSIFVPGGGWGGFASLLDFVALNWYIYEDCGGVPCGDPSGGGDSPVWTLSLAPSDPAVVISNGTPGGMPSDTQLNLTSPLTLPAGTWWLVFFPTGNHSVVGQYGRQPADTFNGYTGQFINPGGGYGYGTEWQDWTVLGPAQQDLAFRLEGAAAPTFHQTEYWEPEHLHLLDWAATGGLVSVSADHVDWHGLVIEPETITLTKWFHVEPCTWTETLLDEALMLDMWLLDERPVTVLKWQPLLWIGSDYDPGVLAGQSASFVLQFGNMGGYEHAVLVRSDFPPAGPFVSSVPPPDRFSPNGLWAEWDVGDLPQGAEGEISVTVVISAGLGSGDIVVIDSAIYNHLGQQADGCITTFVVQGEVAYSVYLPIVARGWSP